MALTKIESTGLRSGLKQTINIGGGDQVTSNSLTVDVESGEFVAVPLTCNVTSVSFSNLPPTGTYSGAVIEFTYPDAVSRTITWGSAIKWPSNTAPTLTSTAGQSDTFVFTTDDNGTTIHAYTAGQAQY